MSSHQIKSIQPYFEDVWNRLKTFVEQREYIPETNTFTGRSVFGRISYLIRRIPYLKEGYCAFALKDMVNRKKITIMHAKSDYVVFEKKYYDPDFGDDMD